MTEGTTDQRFLKSVVERTFHEIKFECETDVEILEIEELRDFKGDSFVEKVLDAAKKGFENFGMTVLCVHTDADSESAEASYQNKIEPAQNALEKTNEDEYCKILTAIIPVRTVESWMLADKELLKKQIGTDKTDQELGINKKPESIAKPKELIEDAIRIAREDQSQRKRKKLSIAELYAPIGQQVDLEDLEKLDSYRDFKNNVRKTFQKLKLLQ